MPSSTNSTPRDSINEIPRDTRASKQKLDIKLPEDTIEPLNPEEAKRIQILKLRKENQLLRKQITEIDQDLTSGKLSIINSKIENLQDIAEVSVKKINAENTKLFDLKNQMEILDKQLLEAVNSRGTVDNIKKGNESISNQIKSLENKLDSTIRKFNDMVSSNKSLRKEIESLREEKVIFNNIYKKMEQELYQKKQQMAEFIELSNNTYADRDEAQDHLKSLLTKRQEELDKFDSQLEELDEIIATDQQLNDQIKKAEKERTSELLGTINNVQEKSLKVKVIKGNWTLAEQAAKHQIMTEKYKKTAEALEYIEKKTGLSTEELIQRFEESEDSYFSTFTYVNDLNSEIESLEQQIHDYQKEISSFEGDEIKKKAYDRQIQVESLKLNLESTHKTIENFQNSISQNKVTLSTIAPLIKQLFEFIGGKPEDFKRIMGSSEINESNIQIYLGVIEHKVNYLRSLYLKDRPEATVAVIKASTPKSPKTASKSEKSKSKRSKLAMQIEFPSLETENSDDDGEFELPLTRDDLLKNEIKL